MSAKKTTKRIVVKKRKAAPKKKRAVKKRKAAVKKPKRPTALAPVELPKTHVIRQQALADYVTDPEGREASYHYRRVDRNFKDYVEHDVFVRWETEDGWVLQREAYWAEAQRQLLEKSRDHTVQILLDSQRELEELRAHAVEWCDPIRDAETGDVLRYPLKDDKGRPHRFAGKPMLAVRPGSFEKAVGAALALDEVVQQRRDEILRLTGNGENASQRVADPVVASLKISAEDLRAMAQEMVKRRQPELVTQAIDVKGDDDE